MRFIFDATKMLVLLRFKRFAPLYPGPPALDHVVTLGTHARALPHDRTDLKKGLSREAQPLFEGSKRTATYFFGRFFTRSSIFVLISAGTSERSSFFLAVL